MRNWLKILPFTLLLFSCADDRLYDEGTNEDKLDPNFTPLVIPMQVYESNWTLEECFYRNNYMKMVATHPQINSYEWFKVDENDLEDDVFLSDSSIYTTSLEGLYRLDIEKNYPQIGEVDTSIYILLEYCPTWIEFPDVFTPSSTQYNTWAPIMEGVSNFYLRITNEDDIVVFETTNPLNEFSGDYNGNPLPSGTYTYYLSGTFKSGYLFEREGNFELVR